jgi:hypothetical protein
MSVQLTNTAPTRQDSNTGWVVRDGNREDSMSHPSSGGLPIHYKSKYHGGERASGIRSKSIAWACDAAARELRLHQGFHLGSQASASPLSLIELRARLPRHRSGPANE